MTTIDLRPDAGKLCQFGICGGAGFGLLGAMAHFVWSLPWLAVILWVLAAFSLLASVTFPRLLWPLYVLLTLVVFPIGLLISYLLLGVLFYGIFTPVGLFFRLIGRDALARRWRPESSSYFTKAGPPRPPEDYYRQF